MLRENRIKWRILREWTSVYTPDAIFRRPRCVAPLKVALKFCIITCQTIFRNPFFPTSTMLKRLKKIKLDKTLGPSFIPSFWKVIEDVGTSVVFFYTIIELWIKSK